MAAAQIAHELTAPTQRSPISIPFVLRKLQLTQKLSARPGTLLNVGICAINALRNPCQTQAWLAFLSEFERQHSLSAALPETVRKPLLNFAVHHLSSAQRIALLRSHYSITAKTLPARILSTLWSGSTVTVGSLTGKKGKYLLTLGPDQHCCKEGELTFTLTAEDGIDLAKLTFTFAVREKVTPERTLLIGGLQGPPTCFGPGAKERIIKATRDLSGLRPKMVVFLAAEALALAAGAKALHAVSNLTHTINGDARYQRRKRYADYDSFWIERGGTPAEWGFSIPLQIGPRAHHSGRNEQRARVGVLVRQLLFQTKNAPIAARV